jgi:hypothetical protein
MKREAFLPYVRHCVHRMAVIRSDQQGLLLPLKHACSYDQPRHTDQMSYGMQRICSLMKVQWHCTCTSVINYACMKYLAGVADVD